MKILAIRGQNLASLAEEFEVDLAGGALGGAGLFAITGPTGAGKSTLLDALCLALFDRAPRLAGRRDAAMIGRDEITSIAAHDVRSLVRRGAAGGWAEVDFEGGDGRRYRARWSARRARQRAEGRFQDQQMTLTCVDTGEKLGGTRTETLDAIRAKLGLSFDQFRRSALLAQGDFAAFLRADAAERADLLERMTGTEIYGAVSIAAFQRAKELAGVAKAREDERARVIVMDADARAAAEAATAEAARAAVAAAERLRAVEAAAAWRATRTALVAAEGEAAAREAAAREAVARAVADRARVARLEAAEALRSPWEARAQATDEARRAAIAAREAARGAEDAEAGRAAAVVLDDEGRHARELAAASGPVARTTRAGKPSASSAAQLRGALGDARAALDDARRWLATSGGLAAVAGDWPRWRRALERETAAADAIARARADGERLTGEAAAADRRAELADASRAAAAAALEAAQALAAAAEGRRTARPADLRRALEAITRRADETAALVELAAGARAAADGATASDARATAARTRAAAAEAIRGHARADEDRGGAALREAEHAHDQLRLAAGLAHHRAALVDGEPCPLCGAEAHPWTGRGALAEVVLAQEARVGELRAQVRAAQNRGAAASAETRAADDEAAAAADDARRARDAFARAADGWRAALAALGELPLVGDPASEAAAALAADHAAAAAAARERARDALAAAEKIDADASHAQQLALARRADLDHAQAEAAEAGAAGARIATRTADARRAVADGGKAREAARDELAPALEAWPDWRARLDRDAARFTDELARGVAAWEARAASLARTAATIDELAAHAAALRLDAERAAAAAAAAKLAADEQLARGRGALDAASATLDRAREGTALDDSALAALFAAGLGAAAALREALAALDREAERAAAVTAERRRALAEHDAARPTSGDDAAPEAARTAARAAADRARDAALALHLDDDARARRAAADAALDAARADALPFETLRDLIGSADGKAFRTFAQGLTLDALLLASNAHLDQLAPRYQLERVPRSDLDLQVVDRDLGDDVRAVQSLSGGESFLVSLALALALSSLSAHDVKVRTLLIDEGFGTLDPAALDVALAVLDALQASGRQVGIISHVPGLAERVGAQIAVRPVGSGRSVVRVRAAS